MILHRWTFIIHMCLRKIIIIIIAIIIVLHIVKHVIILFCILWLIIVSCNNTHRYNTNKSVIIHVIAGQRSVE